MHQPLLFDIKYLRSYSLFLSRKLQWMKAQNIYIKSMLKSQKWSFFGRKKNKAFNGRIIALWWHLCICYYYLLITHWLFCYWKSTMVVLLLQRIFFNIWLRCGPSRVLLNVLPILLLFFSCVNDNPWLFSTLGINLSNRNRH